MDPFVEQLKRLCAAHPTRAKWVFVPTHAIGRTVGDRLVLEGCDWANLRFVTPLDVAVRMGAPFLVERGIDPSEEGLGPALIMRLLIDLPEEDGYFRPLATQPPMAQALWSTIRELRMAGVSAAEFAAMRRAEDHGPKARELSALLSAYESYLAANGRGDLATVFVEAMQHPDWCPIQPQDCWTELPDAIWPPLQRRLIDSMAGERIVPETFELPGARIPRRLAGARVVRRKPDATAPLAFVMAPDEARGQGPTAKGKPQPGRHGQQDLLWPLALGPGPDPPPDFFHAGGAEAEIEEVFRRILGSGRPLDEVEIVCASPSYTTLLWEKALRYDWPVTLAGGVPATLTRPGRALIALAEWIGEDFPAGLLRRLLESGDVWLPDALGLSSGRAARLLVRAQAAWGPHTYRLSLGRLATSARTRASRDDLPDDEKERLEQRAAQAGQLAGWIGALVEAIPAPDRDGRIDLQALVSCAERFVADSAARASALDAAAGTALGGAIAELRALGDFRCTLDQALRFLRERVESVTIGADRPRPGHLHVAPLARCGFSGRSLVFVIGLEEGRVFPAPFEDPVLLDAERARLADALPRSADRTDEAVYAAIGRLASMSARPDVRMCLSYSCRDLREFRQTYASWLMLQAYRVASGNARAAYKDLHDHLGAPRSCVPESASAALGESRWWLRHLAGTAEKGRAAVLKHYAALGAGARAAEERQSDRFTEFDGYVPDAGSALDPCADEAVVSPTQLEEAAGCPFRFFLHRGLRIDAIESGEREKDAWLDPLMRGSLLHDLYAEFLRRCRRENRRARLPGDLEWLKKRGAETLADLAREMPPPSVEIHDRESRAFLDDLALFAAAEAEAPAGRTPIGFEVPFGRSKYMGDSGGTGEPETLGQDEPVVIDLGRGLRFRVAGRIDRIDQVGPSTFEIVDYKTGVYWEADWKGTFAGGRRLQHALYGLAALELLRRRDRTARIAGAQYYFSCAKGQQERRVIATQPLAALGAVLTDLRSVIASGLFVHAEDEGACKWCDFGRACGRDSAGCAGAKMADARLAPYRRLVGHE